MFVHRRFSSSAIAMLIYSFFLAIICSSLGARAWSFFGGSSKGLGPVPLAHTHTASTWRHKRSIVDPEAWRQTHEKRPYTPPWHAYVALLTAYSPSLSNSTAEYQTEGVCAISTLLNTEAGTLYVSATCPLANDATETAADKRRDSDSQLLERALLRSIREYAQGKGPSKY